MLPSHDRKDVFVRGTNNAPWYATAVSIFTKKAGAYDRARPNAAQKPPGDYGTVMMPQTGDPTAVPVDA